MLCVNVMHEIGHGFREKTRMNAGNLQRVGDVALGIHQQFTRQADDPFVRPATGGRRQFRGGSVSDVDADDGKVAVIKFPNVGATATAN